MRSPMAGFVARIVELEAEVERHAENSTRDQQARITLNRELMTLRELCDKLASALGQEHAIRPCPAEECEVCTVLSEYHRQKGNE